MCSLIEKGPIETGIELNAEIRYYTREMSGYESHVFIAVWDSETVLDKQWKKVDSLVAFDYQSVNKVEIERSNYYICHVLKCKISKDLKRIIEQDAFCAKKYIFEKCESNIEIICSEIEDRIFNINIPNSDSFGKAKLSRIELQNFRGYNGKFEFNLLDKNGNPASFVTVYAPNGFGKTSLFDGIEYALKGEVDYLKEVVKNSKFKGGVIYHNKERQEEESYVKLVLDKGGYILRSVEKTDNRGFDLSVVPPKHGIEIVGTNSVSSKWNRIILPYAKLESFISAKNPEDRYEEWLNSIPELNNERADFEKKNNTLKVLRTSLISTDTEYENLRIKANDLKNCEDSINTIKKLIAEFNSKYSYGKLPNLTIVSKEEDLNQLLNDTDTLNRRLQSEKDKLFERMVDYEKYEGLGFDYCKTQYLYLNDIKQLVDNYKKLLQDKNELFRLEQEQKIILDQLEDLKGKLQVYKDINTLGKDNLINMARNYANLYDPRNSIAKSLEALNKDLESIEIQIVNIENQINDCENILETQQLECSVIRYIESLKSDYSENIRLLNKREESIKRINSSIKNYNLKLAENNEIEIPDSIENWDKNKAYKWNGILKDEVLKKLDALYEEYLSNSLQINETKNKKSKSVQLINSIKELGRQFQDINNSNCNCPLCASVFNAPNELYNRIVDYSCELDLDSNLKKLYAKDEVIHKSYQLLSQKIIDNKTTNEKTLRAYIKESYEELNSLNNECKDIKLILSEIKLLMKAQQSQIINSKLFYVESVKEANDYFDSIRMQYERLYQSKNNLIAQQSELKRSILVAQKKLNEILEQSKEYYDNPTIIKYIKFLESIDYDFDNNYQTVLNQFNQYKKKHNEVSIEIAEYKRKSDIILTEDYIQQLLMRLEKILKEYEEFYIGFGKYASLNMDQFNKKKEEELNALETYTEAIDLLSQIVEENGIREYFRNYQEICKTMDFLNSKKGSIIMRIEKITEELIQVQSELEYKIGQFLGKTIMNDIYKKIDPHEDMKTLSYHLSFNEKNKGELYITLDENKTNNEGEYRPEVYFSTAQLNTVAFSSFLGRALDNHSDLALNSVFIDDPIGSFDDMNVLGFADLIRSIIENSNHQIMISTHDERVFRILKRKLDENYYSSCFIVLPQSKSIN